MDPTFVTLTQGLHQHKIQVRMRSCQIDNVWLMVALWACYAQITPHITAKLLQSHNLWILCYLLITLNSSFLLQILRLLKFICIHCHVRMDEKECIYQASMTWRAEYNLKVSVESHLSTPPSQWQILLNPLVLVQWQQNWLWWWQWLKPWRHISLSSKLHWESHFSICGWRLMSRMKPYKSKWHKSSFWKRFCSLSLRLMRGVKKSREWVFWRHIKWGSRSRSWRGWWGNGWGWGCYQC